LRPPIAGLTRSGPLLL